MTPLEKILQFQSLVKDINLILGKNNVKEQISLSDITITESCVSDVVKEEAKLSKAITDLLWPSIKSAVVYHYTSKTAAESILTSGIFRLYNIANRCNEGEVLTFCETHELSGYLQNDENGIPKYMSLIMPNTFYASFTDTMISQGQEEYFWRNFAANDGVRLKIEITASHPDFRRMHYEQVKAKPIKLLSELTRCIREKYNREFILKGISRLCSFYLSGKDYGIENEYRILYRVWDSSGPQPKKHCSLHSYIELPLDVMTECGYQLKIVEVHAFDEPNMPNLYTFSKRDRIKQL